MPYDQAFTRKTTGSIQFDPIQRDSNGNPDPSNPLSKLYTDTNTLQVAIASGGGEQVGLGQTVYQDILDLISTVIYDPNGNTSPQYIPAYGVDPAVVNWVIGALNVNTNSGYEALFILDYSSSQIMLRGLPSDDLAGKVSGSSNAIALAVATDILDHRNIPDITTIGVHDAASAALNIFGDDYAAWAGTLLFPYLGVNNFYFDWLTNSSSFSAIEIDSYSFTPSITF